MTKVRDQDVVNVFSGIADNYKSRRVLVEFYKKNYDAVSLLDLWVIFVLRFGMI